jgi:hypothetical protein
MLGYPNTDLPAKGEYDAWLPIFAEGIDLAMQIANAVKAQKTTGSSPVVGGFAFAYALNPELVTKCAEGYMTGACLEKTDPMLKLRNYVSNKENSGQKNQSQLGKATCYALYKSFRNQPVSSMRKSDVGVLFFRKYYFKKYPREIEVLLPEIKFNPVRKLKKKKTKKAPKKATSGE